MGGALLDRGEDRLLCRIAAKVDPEDEIDSGQRGGTTSEQQDRLKALEQEVRELRRANEILRKASAYFARAELDRRPR